MTETTKTILPKCLDPDFQMGHTAQGYILPCCWSDKPDLFESDMKDLVKEKFKLSNIGSIPEVIHSTEWQTFYDNLKKGQGYKICYIYCGVDNVKEIF